jgi:RNA ligase
MKSIFPTINCIEDIEPISSDFKVYRDEYNDLISICYKHILDYSSFSTPLSRELRGIKFSLSTGKIIARPFHKFFNRGEIPGEEPIGLEYSIWEKLDGSMIHPVITSKGLRLCTKSGITNVSILAEELLSSTLSSKLETLLVNNLTPILEFTSPLNHVVIPYREGKLTLLAIRNTINGEYIDNLEEFSYLELPIPKRYDNLSVLETNELDNPIEGVILVYSNGYRLKIKTKEYLEKAKVLKGLINEKNILELIISNSLDDVIFYLSPSTIESISSYRSKLNDNIKTHYGIIKSLILSLSNLSRKEVALYINKTEGLPLAMHPIFWSLYKSNLESDSYIDIYYEHISKNLGRLDNLKWLLPGFIL